MNGFVNENVGLFYARDKYENILLINEINDTNKGAELICPICGTAVKPRALNSDKVSPHFYHVTVTEHSGEAVLHWWYKNQYLIPGDVFHIDVDGERYSYTCKLMETEKQYRTSVGLYQPDATITTTTGEEIFFEYNYTNKKNSDDYAEKWIELGRNVVEINIKTLSTRKDKVFKSIFFDGVIRCKSRSDRYNVIERHISEQQIQDRLRIKYLNGFLRDVFRYNHQELSLEDIVTIIEGMNENDKLHIPRLLKRLKCNDVLNDYSDYKFNKVIIMMKAVLVDYKELTGDYSWIVDCGYSQKWSKCRGVRFNNTIYVKKYRYSPVYDYNRCKYNDISKGFDIITSTIDEIKMAIIDTLNNEVDRKECIKRDNFRKYITARRRSYHNAVIRHAKSVAGIDYKIGNYSISSKAHPFIYKYFNLEEKIDRYKGTGRRAVIEKTVREICMSLNQENERYSEVSRVLNVLRSHNDEINEFCSNLLNFNVDVYIPTINSMGIISELMVQNEDGYGILELESRELYLTSGYVNMSENMIMEKIKRVICDNIEGFNNLHYLNELIERHYIGRRSLKCEIVNDEYSLHVLFTKRGKKLNTSVTVKDNILTWRYLDKQYNMTIHNFFEVVTVIGHIYDRL